MRDFYETKSTDLEIDDSTVESNEEEKSDRKSYVTHAEVEQMIQQALGSLRVYVLESDITAAQSSVRAIIDQATF